jgi:hypothetical protein
MKKLLAIFLVVLITGCTTVPVIVKFPEVPEILTQPAEKLTPLDASKKIELSDIVKNANENAGKYYQLREKYNAWIKWYADQKKIFETLK